jgi:hypothetical protein
MDKSVELTKRLNEERLPFSVHRTPSRLKSSTSTGPDEIPIILLRKLSSHIAVPLCHIVDASFRSQQLPVEWKHAHVTPIFKKGATCEPNNYRPIS